MSSSQPSLQDENIHLSPGPRPDPASDPLDEFVRLPGLLRRWELSQVVQPSADYRIEAAGETADGTPVFAVYHREHTPVDDTDVSVPVTVSFENGQRPVRARLMPLHSGDPIFGVLVVSHDPDDPGLQARVREHLARMPAPPSASSSPTASTVPTSTAHAASAEESPCSRQD